MPVQFHSASFGSTELNRFCAVPCWVLRMQTRRRPCLASKRLSTYRTLQTWKQLLKYEQTMILAMEKLGEYIMGTQEKKRSILFGGK